MIFQVDTAPCTRRRFDVSSLFRSYYTEEYCRQLLQWINDYYNEDGTQKSMNSWLQSFVNGRLRIMRWKLSFCTDFYGIKEPERNQSPQNGGPNGAPADTPTAAQGMSPSTASTAAPSSGTPASS